MKTILKRICKILTLTISLDNVLALDKYNERTKFPKENICVLGISKL